jgi:hypothetical protein
MDDGGSTEHWTLRGRVSVRLTLDDVALFLHE